MVVVLTNSKCSNKEIFQQVSHAEIALDRNFPLKSFDVRIKTRNACQHVSDFDRDRILTYCAGGFSYRNFVAHIIRIP